MRPSARLITSADHPAGRRLLMGRRVSIISKLISENLNGHDEMVR